MGLRTSVLPLAGNRHILLFPARSSRSVPVVLTAHYDRAPGSPGANDNSAAVFILIEAALKLRGGGQGLIIFTDKEELGPGESLRSQGSYTLARALRATGAGRGGVYIFDACGCGDTLVISTTADHVMKNQRGLGIARTRQAVRQLRSRVLETARLLRLERFILAPTPFSEDAGFLRGGIAAQTITVLPAAEAAPFCAVLRRSPGLADALVTREARERCNPRLIPETWRILNTPQDRPQRLTPGGFSQVLRLALGLCGAREERPAAPP